MATHTYCYALAPCCTPPPHPSFLLWTSTDGLLSSLLVLGVCCGLAGLTGPLGTALFSLSLTLNLQTVSNLTHLPPSLRAFQPYCVSRYVFNTADEWGGSDVAFESASTQYKKIKPMLVLVVPVKEVEEEAERCKKTGIQ